MLDSDYSDCFSCLARGSALPLARGGKRGGCLTFALTYMGKMAISESSCDAGTMLGLPAHELPSIHHGIDRSRRMRAGGGEHFAAPELFGHSGLDAVSKR